MSQPEEYGERYLTPVRVQPARKSLPEKIAWAFLDATTYAAFIKDDRGTFLYANLAYCALLGRELEEVLDRSDADLFPPDVAAQNRRNDHHVLVTERPLPLIETFPDASGARREWSCLKFPIVLETGERYIGGITIDITDQRRMQRAVVESQARMKAALEGGFDAFFVLEAVRDDQGALIDFRFADVNRNAESLMGRSRWEVVGKNLSATLDSKIPSQYASKFIEVVESQKAIDEECIYETARGGEWMRHQIVPLGDGVALTLRDIGEQKRAEAVAKEHTQVLENALGGIAFMTDEGWFTFVNAEFARMLGEPPEAFLGVPWTEVFAVEEHETVREALARTHVDKRAEVECRGERPDGHELYMRCVFIPSVKADRTLGCYLFAADVTATTLYERRLIEQNQLLEAAHAELEAANARLRELAITDSLTGVYNRREFSDRLEECFGEALRYDTPFSVLLLDIDKFKQHNDRFGHPAGDDVLRQVGEILRREARAVDVVARYGGEEFVILLPQTDLEGGIAFAERLRLALQDEAWPKRAITASIGCASRTPSHVTADQIVEDADRALYRAKAEGRNRVMAAAPRNG